MNIAHQRLRYYHPLLKSLLNSLPVDHIPDSIEVLGLAVLILEIVGMLPSINTKQRNVSADNRILVGVCLDLNLTGLGVLDQPSPTRTLDTGEGGIELVLEAGEVSIEGFDGSLVIWLAWTATLKALLKSNSKDLSREL